MTKKSPPKKQAPQQYSHLREAKWNDPIYSRGFAIGVKRLPVRAAMKGKVINGDGGE